VQRSRSLPESVNAGGLAPVALWGAAGVAAGVASALVARSEPGYAIAHTAPLAAVELVAGYAVVSAGLHVRRRRLASRSGLLLVVAGIAWFLVEWNNPGAGSAAVFAIGLVLYAAAAPVVAHAVLAYPSGRLGSTLQRAAVAMSYAGSLLLLGLLPAAVFDPAAAGCSECPPNLLLVRGSEQTHADLTRAGVYAGLAWSVLLGVLAIRRIMRESPSLRRLTGPVAGAGAAYLALTAAGFAHSLDRGFLSNDPVDRRLWLGQAGALVLLSLAVLWSEGAPRRARTALARLVVEIAASPPAGALERSLARRLDDPGLRLAYPIADGRHVDALGREVPLTGSETPLRRDGVEVAVLVHSPDRLPDRELVEEVVSTTRLVLENERLRAELGAQLEDLRASRGRIVEAADRERRRLERDLHDGAQQRLVGLALALGLLRSQLGARPAPALLARIDEADGELRSALDELRSLARGIFPAVLDDEGFAAAVEALAEEAAVPPKIERLPEERFARPAETAAYIVVNQTLRANQAPIRLLADQCEDGLVLELECERVPDDLFHLEDRIGALDGTIEVAQLPDGRVRIRAEVPCEF
jgi:signal transduction histidine kinase